LLRFNSFDVLIFDCYGTLIDWESGILSALKPLLLQNRISAEDNELLELYAKFESEAEQGEYIKYKDILKSVALEFASHFKLKLNGHSEYFISESIKNWLPFPDTNDALNALHEKYDLAVLSNIDNDLFKYSSDRLGVKFDHLFTSEDIGSYKPAKKNFEYAIEKIGLPKQKLLHVAQSLYHDIAVAKSLNISTVWVNRRSGSAGSGATPELSVVPDLEVPDLKSLVDIIDAQSK